MKDGPNITQVAALIGDPARANMLVALMSGKALTATELAQEAGVTLQTASAHLAKLVEGGLLQNRKQGRHKYFTLANGDVAQLLEQLMGVAARAGQMRTQTGPRDQALRKARVCYNHLAGDMGVHLYESLVDQGYLTLVGDEPELTALGAAHFESFGIDLPAMQSKRSPLCRSCLDWSERKSHLAGQLGRALLTRFETLGWVKRVPNSRVLRFSREGEIQFRARFPL